jgi:TolA-binding protein
MRRFTILCASVIVAGGLVVACGERQQTEAGRARDQVQESARATGDYLAKKKDEAQQQLEQRLEDLKGRIQALEGTAKQGNPAAQQALEDARDTLSEQQAKAEKALGDLKDASSDAWHEARDRASAALDALGRTVDDVASRLG